MKIQSTTIDSNGVTRYHYKYSDLKWFLTQGFKSGDVGVILVKSDNMFKTYRGFGTFENPIFHLRRMSFVNNPMFNIPINEDKKTKISFRWVIMDFSENQK